MAMGYSNENVNEGNRWSEKIQPVSYRYATYDLNMRDYTFNDNKTD